jgi:hypothetical protein
LIFDSGDVSRGSFVSRDSAVLENARVRDAVLRNGSGAAGSCCIYEATLDEAYVAGRTIVAGREVFVGEKSIVECRSVSGRARITRSYVGGLVEVFDDAVVDQVYLDDAVMVYGNAKLFGPFVIAGFARIHEGTWSRAPLQLKLPHCHLTECIEDRILIECRCRTRAYWLRHGAAFGRRNGWTEDQIEETVEIIRGWPHSLPKESFDAIRLRGGGTSHLEAGAGP